MGGSQNYINKLARFCDTNTHSAQVMPSANVGEIPDKRIRCVGCNTYKKPGSGSLMQQDPVYRKTVDDHPNPDGEEDVSQDDTGSASDAESHSSEQDDGNLGDTNGMGERFLAGASAVGFCCTADFPLIFLQLRKGPL